MAVETDIMEALFTRLEALVLSPALPVAWPNLAFDPPADQRYLRVQFVPNLNIRLLIDSDGPHQHLGLLQVSVYWTKGEGEAGAREVAGDVAAHFAADLRLTAGGISVRITKNADARDMIVEDAAVQVPVMISWEAYI